MNNVNHIVIARELFTKCDVPNRGLAAARLAMLRLGLNSQDVIKVSRILNSM